MLKEPINLKLVGKIGPLRVKRLHGMLGYRILVKQSLRSEKYKALILSSVKNVWKCGIKIQTVIYFIFCFPPQTMINQDNVHFIDRFRDSKYQPIARFFFREVTLAMYRLNKISTRANQYAFLLLQQAQN